MNALSRTLLIVTPWIVLGCDVPEEPATAAALVADEEDADEEDVEEGVAEALDPGEPAWLQDTAADPQAGLLCILCILGGAQPACGADGQSYANSCFAACEGGGAVPAVTYWPDEDGDGFGDGSAASASACTVPDGASDNGDDCDDADDAVSPGSPEVCDGVDNDCDAASRCEAESCADIALEDASASDGEYTLYAGLDPDRPWTAYCHDMAGEPRTYLSLVAVGEERNFAQYTAASSVRTNFTRVRIEPTTLVVDIDDLTFASSSGALYHGQDLVTAMPYGVAESCNYGVDGLANIDLTGTPFKIASPFCTAGFEAFGGVTFSQDDQVADILGGGYCGWTSPTCSYGPHQLMNTVNGWILQLAYVEP